MNVKKNSGLSRRHNQFPDLISLYGLCTHSKFTYTCRHNTEQQTVEFYVPSHSNVIYVMTRNFIFLTSYLTFLNIHIVWSVVYAAGIFLKQLFGDTKTYLADV